MKLDKLVWQPWIGTNYISVTSPNRILIIGESHYWNKESGDTIEECNQIDYTQTVIQSNAIGGNHGASKLFNNLHSTLVSGGQINAPKFWGSVCYYNFIQRLMTNIDERPTKKDFENGWQAFREIVNEVKPDVCLFLGLKASDYFYAIDMLQSNKSGYTKWENKLNNVYPRTTGININGSEIKLIFIKHCSNYFTPGVWNKFLKEQIPEQMNWISKNFTSHE